MAVQPEPSGSKDGDQHGAVPQEADSSAAGAPAVSSTATQNTSQTESLTLKQKIFRTMEDPSYSPLAQVISLVIMFLITLSTVSFILETEYREPHLKVVWTMIEAVATITFTVEYLIKLLTCENPRKFAVGWMNLVDLAAILPFWLATLSIMSSGGVGFIRAIRLIRVFRVFKFGRYSNGIQIFVGAITTSMQPLAILCFLMLIAMIISSSLMYYAEGDVNESFDTIPNAFWWCLVTISTVGYGDAYPITKQGKVVASLTMFAGVLILALPITVVGSNFAKMVEMFEDDAMTYSVADNDQSGIVDEMELREFLVAKKKDGVLRKDTDTRAASLLAKYDKQGKGGLNPQEFQELQRDVLTTTEAENQHHKDLEKVENRVQEIITARTQFKTDVYTRLDTLEGMIGQIMTRLDTIEPLQLPRQKTLELPPITSSPARDDSLKASNAKES